MAIEEINTTEEKPSSLRLNGGRNEYHSMGIIYCENSDSYRECKPTEKLFLALQKF